MPAGFYARAVLPDNVCADCSEVIPRVVKTRSIWRDGAIVCATCDEEAEQHSVAVVVLLAFTLEKGNDGCKRLARIMWRMIDGHLDSRTMLSDT